MNEFTKEELGMLKGAISLWIEEIVCTNPEGNKIYSNLYKKIGLMIDNYCEHTGHIGIHEWKTCNDCGQPFK